MPCLDVQRSAVPSHGVPGQLCVVGHRNIIPWCRKCRMGRKRISCFWLADETYCLRSRLLRYVGSCSALPPSGFYAECSEATRILRNLNEKIFPSANFRVPRHSASPSVPFTNANTHQIASRYQSGPGSFQPFLHPQPRTRNKARARRAAASTCNHEMLRPSHPPPPPPPPPSPPRCSSMALHSAAACQCPLSPWV